MSNSAMIACVVAGTVTVFATAGSAAPLSVNIVDHDFTFDVPCYLDGQTGAVTGAVYDYAGGQADQIHVTAPVGDHNAGTYTYAGRMPQVPGGPGPGKDLYPLLQGSQFGAKLELKLFFDSNDGPYVNSQSGDRFDISLVGGAGFLRVTGKIASPTTGAPIFPASGQDIVLLDITFTRTSLLARAGYHTADLVEAAGQVNTLLGWSIDDLASQYPAEWGPLRQLAGVTWFKFMLPATGGAIYPAADYDPLADYGLGPIYGRVSGEAGAVPEPASILLLAVGGLAVLPRRRKA